ncbi:hypothetical protein, variant 2 [Blastomyces gilchristii SLH14081]|uniref:Uncharacterized protein n=1 Tax=Blastomyces gilchristii (strain SLH14081) TaxID=559298 RepID=A0A179UVR4_BLAGS|nr:uncharacterized protein BDBG_17601 [Blastomyces gilchristii SLH14081]XP_031580130.1 hypothetical protein, variant 1 [Blastomyces gilchristii SLH14081]XP_031580131.1 hypothetical protein, variant 2 [Blastomyces gilchristii SLH14081]OAT11929.1 hypothetical protein BDBG_17601 [Blastomyces gilchristii SLH14081]OAT11930.1 hypothetical protein, variant 1 [Blastomyces gilchristii SLH14081]OAT11931.1 hypothetical protein, variant 2 [Blastomyces gilchristii SLH14081]
MELEDLNEMIYDIEASEQVIESTMSCPNLGFYFYGADSDQIGYVGILPKQMCLRFLFKTLILPARFEAARRSRNANAPLFLPNPSDCGRRIGERLDQKRKHLIVGPFNPSEIFGALSQLTTPMQGSLTDAIHRDFFMASQSYVSSLSLVFFFTKVSKTIDALSSIAYIKFYYDLILFPSLSTKSMG